MIKKLLNFLHQPFRDGRVPHSRKSSAPFISGDSFMRLADYVFLKEFDLRYLSSLLVKIQNEIAEFRKIMFIEVCALERIDVLKTLVLWIENSDTKNFKNLTILIHNGDKIPTKSFFETLVSNGLNVFSVNVSVNNYGVTPLPIGLENRHLRKNGIGLHFNIPQDGTFKVNSGTGRKTDLFASFNVSTNMNERSKAKSELIKHGYSFIEPNLTTERYQNCLKNSRFVISPPGNGIDCHRTWEAIYLGAVPIVLRTCLNEELINMFPIVAVSEWSEFLETSEIEREILISKFDGVKYPALNIEYWQRLFMNSKDK